MIRTNRKLLFTLTGSIRRFNTTNAYSLVTANLKKDLKHAMLEKNNIRKTTIRSMLSTLKNKAIDTKSHTIDEFGIYETYGKMISQRNDSVREYQKNERIDLMDKEQQELDIIKSYQQQLPVINPEDLETKCFEILVSLKKDDPKLPLKQVFGKINLTTLPNQWKASPSMIRRGIAKQYKTVFN